MARFVKITIEFDRILHTLLLHVFTMSLKCQTQESAKTLRKYYVS